MTERDYVLGTHDAEIERLGLQHRVWRPRALDAWQRAGISTGQTVLDIGAGPGFATVDLAEIVGPAGRVIAFERSARFLSAISTQAIRAGLNNIETVAADLVDAPLPDAVADALWCRWVLSFVSDPAGVVRKMAAALKPGGVAVFHEYLDYGAWGLLPPSAALTRFVVEVMASWRDDGGEPDVANRLPGWLAGSGMEILAVRPIVDVVPPRSFVWQWPASFVDVNVDRLCELGRLSAAEGAAARDSVIFAARDPQALMITPIVLEIIARRR